MTLTADSLCTALQPWSSAPRWWLGLSGGLDSCLLLSLLAELQRLNPATLPPLAAIHVNHQLHPEAPGWAAHCASLCESLGVPLETIAVEVDPAGEGPEGAAREARYRAFESRLGAGEVLMLAHHRDDQVETFFLRLMRGAGTRGLSGMPATRALGAGTLLRPLLAHTRAELEHCARERGLQWLEDPSNELLDADRNFLRQALLPQLATRWPGYRHSVIASMGALADAEQVISQLDQARLSAAAGVAFGEPWLEFAALETDLLTERARLLRRWLESQGAQPPARARLLEFSRQFEDAAEDSQPALQLGTMTLRRYRQRVYLVSSTDTLPATAWLAPGQPLTLPGLGCLRVDAADSGLRLPPAGGWQLRWRSGGERCRPQGRARSQALKQLLQERGVPPWVRQRLPLLYDEDELAAVADLWICEGHQAPAGGPAFRVCWQPLRVGAD